MPYPVWVVHLPSSSGREGVSSKKDCLSHSDPGQSEGGVDTAWMWMVVRSTSSWWRLVLLDNISNRRGSPGGCLSIRRDWQDWEGGWGRSTGAWTKLDKPATRLDAILLAPTDDRPYCSILARRSSVVSSVHEPPSAAARSHRTSSLFDSTRDPRLVLTTLAVGTILLQSSPHSPRLTDRCTYAPTDHHCRRFCRRKMIRSPV